MTPTPEQTPQEPWNDDSEFHLPEDHWHLPELVHTEKPHVSPSQSAFIAVAASPEYRTLRSRFRRFAFPMTIAGLVSYFIYVLLSIYAPAAMATPLLGAVNVGMTLGLAQFAVTYLWTVLYMNYAAKKLDPISSALKAKLETGAGA